MAKTPYGSLSAARQRDALWAAAAASHDKEQVLEKDIWVVATLQALFDAPYGSDLALKGGTSS